MDENLIAYGGDLSVQGKPCEFPFMMNEKYNMTSQKTKKKKQLTQIFSGTMKIVQEKQKSLEHL